MCDLHHSTAANGNQQSRAGLADEDRVVCYCDYDKIQGDYTSCNRTISIWTDIPFDIRYEEAALDSLDIARFIVETVEDKKAEDILLLDLRPDTVLADFFILCNANSDRQLRAMAENVREAVKERFGKLPLSMEGTPESGWILIDYADVVVHLFLEEERDYYALEQLWMQEGNVLVSIQ